MRFYRDYGRSYRDVRFASEQDYWKWQKELHTLEVECDSLQRALSGIAVHMYDAWYTQKEPKAIQAKKIILEAENAIKHAATLIWKANRALD